MEEYKVGEVFQFGRPCSAVQRDDHEHVFFERVGEVCDNSEEDS